MHKALEKFTIAVYSIRNLYLMFIYIFIIINFMASKVLFKKP